MIDENHQLVGQSPYSASKIASDQLALSYYKSFKTPIKIIRPFNTYGPRQSARAVIPSIISQLLKNNSSISLGSLAPTRDLTYVDDTCSAFLEISSEDSFFGEVVNVGNNKEISIGDLATLISKIMKIEISIENSIERIRPENSEVFRLVCDNSKLMANSNWRPKVDLKSGLYNVIGWMKSPENSDYFKSDIYNV